MFCIDNYKSKNYDYYSKTSSVNLKRMPRRNVQKKRGAPKALQNATVPFLTGKKHKHVGGFCIQCTREKLTENKLYSSSCPICFEDITSKNNVQFNCGHNACKDCICRIIESCDAKCPCCRTVIDDLTFENREHFKTLYKLCDENWMEVSGMGYLDFVYHKLQDKLMESKFMDNYKYTWAYKKAKETLKKGSDISDKKIEEILMKLRFTHFRKLLVA